MNLSTSTSIIVAIIISFAVSVILCPIVIPMLRKMKFGQYIREVGPQSHQSKAGTPTMGGMIILASVIVTSLVFIFVQHNTKIVPVLFVTVGFGIIGFADDYIKVVKKRNLGLTELQKLIGQFVVTAVFCFYIMNYSGLGTKTIIPFTGGMEVTMPWWLFVPFVFVVVIGTVNGANFTDGLDGLATSVTIIISVFFTMVAIGSGVEAITAAFVGALLGFFLYNVYPARVFMGDTGSLALGGFVAATAFMLKMPIFIVIVAFIYLIEVISVMIQVTWFKYTKKKFGEGRRVFKMAPLHHHFQESGYSETQVVAAFAVVTAILCLLAYLAL
ncbi:MAG: phospho-N-acetylmuramoyl-pentapeptide-transferase [Eubacterium sp.]